MGFRSATGTLLGKHGTGLPPGLSVLTPGSTTPGPWGPGVVEVALATFTRRRAWRDTWP
jgi:hypothetical protein